MLEVYLIGMILTAFVSIIIIIDHAKRKYTKPLSLVDLYVFIALVFGYPILIPFFIYVKVTE